MTRRVVVTLELETDARLPTLKSKKAWQCMLRDAIDVKVLQAQANVVAPEKSANDKAGAY